MIGRNITLTDAELDAGTAREKLFNALLDALTDARFNIVLSDLVEGEIQFTQAGLTPADGLSDDTPNWLFTFGKSAPGSLNVWAVNSDEVSTANDMYANTSPLGALNRKSYQDDLGDPVYYDIELKFVCDGVAGFWYLINSFRTSKPPNTYDISYDIVGSYREARYATDNTQGNGARSGLFWMWGWDNLELQPTYFARWNDPGVKTPGYWENTVKANSMFGAVSWNVGRYDPANLGPKMISPVFPIHDGENGVAAYHGQIEGVMVATGNSALAGINDFSDGYLSVVTPPKYDYDATMVLVLRAPPLADFTNA